MKPSFDADLRISILVPKGPEGADLPSYLSLRLETGNAPFDLDFRTADVTFVGELIDDLTQIRTKMADNPNNISYAGKEETEVDNELDVKLTQFGLVPVPPQGGNNPTKE